MEEIIIKYNIKKKSQVKIFGDKFIETNKNNYEMRINEKTEEMIYIELL